MLDWKRLCRLKSGTPVEELGQSVVSLGNDAFKLSETQYCLARVSDDNVLRVVSMYWACNEKSFRHAYFGDIEGDDLISCTPPNELLPPKSGATFRKIMTGLKAFGAKGVMENASYRIMSDGAFIQKEIGSNVADYYFRSPHSDDNELPYAILWKMKIGW